MTRISEILRPGANVHDHHKHRCRECGTIWEHDNLLLLTKLCTLDQYDAAHKCPKCGHDERDKFFENRAEELIYAMSLPTDYHHRLRDGELRAQLVTILGGIMETE